MSGSDWRKPGVEWLSPRLWRPFVGEKKDVLTGMVEMIENEWNTKGKWEKIGIIIGGLSSGPAGISGAVAGGAAGRVFDKIIEKEKTEAYQKGREDEKAENAVRIQRMREMIERANQSMQSANEHYQLTIALIAVGMAAANAVGKDSSEDKANIAEFVVGISAVGLPDKVKAVVDNYKRNPPTMHKACEEARKLQTVDRSLFREVILLALDEEAKTPAGKKILDEWDQEFA